MRRMIRIYDTTLRDGTQGEGVSFSMEDKVRLASRFDACIGTAGVEGVPLMVFQSTQSARKMFVSVRALELRLLAKTISRLSGDHAG